MAAAGKRALSIVLLNRQELQIFFEERKVKLRDIYQQACDHLGFKETEFCGLAELIDGEYRFLDLETPIIKLVPKKIWKTALQDNTPMMKLHFRIHLYVDHVSFLKDKVTRHLHYLQLRDNLLDYRHLLSDETYFLLAAYALQADLGSFKGLSSDTYFEPEAYFPSRVIERYGREYILSHLPALHGDLQDMTKSQAATQFIRLASQKPWTHNLHFYWLKRRKTDPQPNAWLALAMHALEIYEEVNGYKSLLSEFPWGEIVKLHSEKKYFEIRTSGAEDRKFVYHTGSEQRSKYLLRECQLTHKFYMSMRSRLLEIQHMEQRDRWYETRSNTSDIGLPATPSKTDVSDLFGSSPHQSSSVRSSLRSNNTDAHSRTLPVGARIQVDKLASPMVASSIPVDQSRRGLNSLSGETGSIRTSLKVTEVRNSIRRPETKSNGWIFSNTSTGPFEVNSSGLSSNRPGSGIRHVDGRYILTSHNANEINEPIMLSAASVASNINELGYSHIVGVENGKSIDKQQGVMRSASEGQHVATQRLTHGQQAALRRTSEIVMPRIAVSSATGTAWPERQFALPIIGPQLALPVMLDNRTSNMLSNGRQLTLPLDSPVKSQMNVKPPPQYAEAVKIENSRILTMASPGGLEQSPSVLIGSSVRSDISINEPLSKKDNEIQTIEITNSPNVDSASKPTNNNLIEEKQPSVELDKSIKQLPPSLTPVVENKISNEVKMSSESNAIEEVHLQSNEKLFTDLKKNCPLHADIKMDEIRRGGENTPFLKGLINDRSLCTCGRDNVLPRYDYDRSYAFQMENNLRRDDISRSNNRLAEVRS